MSGHPTFQEVVKKVMADSYGGMLSKEPGHDRWNEKLKSFFHGLLDHKPDGQLWDSIAEAAAKHGLSREACFHRIAYSAAAALAEGDPADIQNASPKALRSQSEQYLELAQCAQLLADHYRKRLKIFSGKDQRSGALAQWYDDEAQEFRRASDRALENIAYTSRQNRGKTSDRERLSFVRSLVISMRRNFGKPHYEAVAAIASIAYSKAKSIDAEYVRTVCRGLPQIDRASGPTEEEKQLTEAFIEALGPDWEGHR